MNKKIFVLLIVCASFLTLGLLAIPLTSVLAQAGGPCVDAAGTPCTPTPDPSTGGGGSATNPTSTSLPLTNPNPTQGTSTAGASWSGTCSGATIQETTRCIGLFHNGCGYVGGSVSSTVNKDGSVDLTCTVPVILPTPDPSGQLTAPEFPLPDDGFLGSCTNDNLDECLDQFKCEDGLLVIKVDLYAPGGTKYDFYCIPHEDASQLNFPIAIPDDGATEDNWTGGCATGCVGAACNGGDGLEACLNIYAGLCAADGGDMSVWYDDDSNAGVYCENQPDAVPPAPEIVAAPTDDGHTSGDSWEEECSWASCWMADISCFIDGGTGYVVEDTVGNTGYHCDLPSDEAPVPPGGWSPWLMIGIIAILVGMLLPAVQKVREAAARMGQTKEHILLNKDDGGGTEGGTGKAPFRDIHAKPDDTASTGTGKADMRDIHMMDPDHPQPDQDLPKGPPDDGQ